MVTAGYTLTGTADDLLRRFRVAKEEDLAAERFVKRLTVATILAGVLLFIGLFVGTGALDEDSVPEFLGYWVVVLLVVIASGVYVAWFRARFDLDDRKIGTVIDFLSVVRADTPVDAPMTVEVDYRGARRGGRLIQKRRERSTAVTLEIYEHAWLTLSGALVDGSQYRVRVTERLVRKSKSKRKGVKSRERVIGRVGVSLRLGGRRAPDAGQVAAQLNQTRPPEPFVPRVVAGKGRRLAASLALPAASTVSYRGTTTRTDAGNLADAGKLLSALVWAYQAVGRTAATPGV